tara:strand:+ start:351 stop:578 length:228 start_codon:yes stop_codon:yes gene_type:complete
MKLNPNSTRPQIFERYTHPWYEHNEKLDKTYEEQQKKFIPHWQKNIVKPNPPTAEAIQKAKFVDKTFAWRNDARI